VGEGGAGPESTRWRWARARASWERAECGAGGYGGADTRAPRLGREQRRFEAAVFEGASPSAPRSGVGQAGGARRSEWRGGVRFGRPTGGGDGESGGGARGPRMGRVASALGARLGAAAAWLGGGGGGGAGRARPGAGAWGPSGGVCGRALRRTVTGRGVGGAPMGGGRGRGGGHEARWALRASDGGQAVAPAAGLGEAACVGRAGAVASVRQGGLLGCGGLVGAIFKCSALAAGRSWASVVSGQFGSLFAWYLAQPRSVLGRSTVWLGGLSFQYSRVRGTIHLSWGALT
jgi:hypothetical protein